MDPQRHSAEGGRLRPRPRRTAGQHWPITGRHPAGGRGRAVNGSWRDKQVAALFGTLQHGVRVRRPFLCFSLPSSLPARGAASGRARRSRFRAQYEESASSRRPLKRSGVSGEGSAPTPPGRGGPGHAGSCSSAATESRLRRRGRLPQPHYDSRHPTRRAARSPVEAGGGGGARPLPPAEKPQTKTKTNRPLPVPLARRPRRAPDMAAPGGGSASRGC